MDIKLANNLIEIIYAYEPLAYYFNLKPDEYWNGIFGQIMKYCQIQMVNKLDSSREQVNLLEIATDKMAQCFSTRPRKIRIRDYFKGLFPKTNKNSQSAEEQMAILLSMESDGNL